MSPPEQCLETNLQIHSILREIGGFFVEKWYNRLSRQKVRILHFQIISLGKPGKDNKMEVLGFLWIPIVMIIIAGIILIRSRIKQKRYTKKDIR